VARSASGSLADRRRPLIEAWLRFRAREGLPPVDWDLVVKDPAEAAHRSPLYLDMTTDAVILFDRGGFVKECWRE
jgi:hypothetical protein